MSSFSRIQLENWLKQIDVKGSVIDIGGAQNPIKGRTKSWDISDYKILDLEEPHQCKQKPDIIWDLNKRPISGLGYEKEFEKIVNKDYEIIPFDVVFCLEVFEYIWNPIDALRNIGELLKKDGIFYSSWHFIYPHHNPRELDFLRYTPMGVNKLLREVNFEILEHLPRTTQVADLRETWASEQMRGWKDMDNTIIGSLVKARKM